MKALKIVFILMAIAFVGVFGYYQIKNNSENIHFKNPFDNNQNSDIQFRISDIRMTLNREWSLLKGIVAIKLDFTVENISKEPQVLSQNNLSLFDYNGCRYDASTTFYSKQNPLLFSETINSNTKKMLSLIFEVPQNELYSVGYSDNIKRIGKQIFIDKIRNIECEYVTFKEMVEVRNRLINKFPKQNSCPKTEELGTLEVLFDGPTNSVYESLTKKGTNPSTEMPVDLNDFLGTPDDGTDWNYTELSEEHCKALASKGVYYSENKGAWVQEKPTITDNDALDAQERREMAEQELRKQSVCRISFDLQGRQTKQIPTVPNSNSTVGIIIMKIEVSPKGDVVNYNIDNRSSIDNSEIRQVCVSATLKTKFNIVDNKRSQFGIIRYIFQQ